MDINSLTKNNVLLTTLLIFVLRIVGITIGTVRMLFMTRGHKIIATLMSFFEILIFVLAIGPVMQHLDKIWYILSYAGGFSAGTWLGMLIEERMALGFGTIRVISLEKSTEIAEAIRQAGYAATEFIGYGAYNQVEQITAVIRRREIPYVIKIVAEVDPTAFVTVEETKAVYRGHLHRITRPVRLL